MANIAHHGPALEDGIMTERLIESEKVSSLGLSSGEKIKVLGIFASIICATVLGFIGSTIIGNMSVVLAGLGVVAFVFGLRHGVDADHIAAIDNTTRKLMQERKRPLTVGTWFSLGHSTIVVGLIVALVLSTRAVAGVIPALQSTGVVIGTAVSGTFLWLIGLINVVIVLGIYKTYKQLRTGQLEFRTARGVVEQAWIPQSLFLSPFQDNQKALADLPHRPAFWAWL